MFPSDVDLSTITYTNTEATTQALDLTTLGKSLAFDYSTNTFLISAGTNVIPSTLCREAASRFFTRSTSPAST